MRLDEYLKTRIVEQVVHLDDLARSLGREPWPVPLDGARPRDPHRRRHRPRLRSGPTEMLRCLYRSASTRSSPSSDPPSYLAPVTSGE